MEDWRTMAAAVTGDYPMTTAASQAIGEAQSHFARAAEVCGRYRQELPYQPAGAGDALPHLPTAMDDVRIAILCTRRFSMTRAGSGHVFSLCTARIGLQDTAPEAWQRWEGHRAEAAAHAAMALRRLHSAWSLGAAASDAVHIMHSMAPLRISGIAGGGHAADKLLDHDFDLNFNIALSCGFCPAAGLPLWDAWGHAAEQLLRRAADELAMARAALDQMRRAVVAEFFDACGLLVCF